ncbi:MAG: phosphate/phosphite/phosphonate ABC transporter substrate-binding protein [Proteobacteria bacterium]|nr:phosphate/phosphite/phosphonate ABC transporter substrate-binding protein [Pseudomonadota bacterium]
MNRALPAAVFALGLALSASPASAQSKGITVGLFAPTTPIGGPSERVEFVNNLASHLAAVTGRTVSGRVYSRARSFTSAIKKGEIQFAVVDAPYAAARRLPYTMLAAAMRNGRSTVSWLLISSGGVTSLADLKSKQIAVPKVGAKVPGFVTNVLLEGEVDVKFFRKITTAPNANAAATMVSVGRVKAALVPEGTSLPSDVNRVLTLRTVGLPMFVATKNADRTASKEFSRAVLSYSGRGVISGFAPAKQGNYQALRAQFGKSKRRGVMAVPKPARLAVSGILDNRKFAIATSDLSELVSAPVKASARVKKGR